MQLQKAKQMTNLAKKLNFVFGRDENILGERENAGYQHFLLFPQCFQKASFLGSFKIEIAWLRNNHFPNKPWFLPVCSISLLKTVWEKEKLLVTSNFSIPALFSTCLENFVLFSSNLKLLFENSISLEESKICHLGKG